MRCPGLQDVLLCHVEHRLLKTTGSEDLAPDTSLTSSYSLPTMVQPRCFSDAPGFQPHCPCTCLSLYWEPPSIWYQNDFLPQSIQTFVQISPAQWSFSPLYFNLQPYPKYTPSPVFFFCFVFIHSTDHFLTVYFLILFVYVLFSPSECKLSQGREFCLLRLPLPVRPAMGTP